MSSLLWSSLTALTAAALLGTVVLAAPPRGPGGSPPPQGPRTDPGPNPGRPVPPDRPARPPDNPDNIGDVYEGILVSAGAGKVVTTDGKGNERMHTLSATAQIICNGRKCTVVDLRKGMTVQITTRPADPKIAVRVIARTTGGS